MSQIIGSGTYGIIVTKDNETCRKIFSKSQKDSLIREASTLKRLQQIRGVTELIKLDQCNEEDRKLIGKPVYGVIVMKRYKITLDKCLPLNHDDKIRIIKELVRIVAEIHACKIVHADIKLENVMLTDNNEVKLIDFGLSGPIDKALLENTTKVYRPIKIVHEYCHDIYSLGILFIEILIGSIMTDRFRYKSCVKMLKEINLDGLVRQLIIAMIDPDCHKRPTAKEIANFFDIVVNEEIVDLEEINFDELFQ